MSLRKVFTDGLTKNNPILIQLVGMCSVLAVSSSLINAVGMGVSVIFVLTLSNLAISILRNFIPDKVRIPAYIVIIATFVTIVDMVLNAFVPALYDALGIFIPLIVVNCIILARAESFASKHGPVQAIVDGLGQGLGYTWAIALLGIIRELFGSASFLGNPLFGESFKGIGMISQAPGAFILLGIFIASFNTYTKKREKKLREGVKS